MRKLFALPTVAFLLLIGLTSAGFAGENTYTVADSTGDWGFPSPYGMYPRGPGYIRMSLCFDTLVWKDKEGLTPALASSWRYSKNKNQYVFHLRKNVRWHDGETFTADDVVFTFDYVKRHPWPWINGDIVKEAVALDHHTVRVVLNRRYAPFLTNIAGTLPILPEHIWRSVDDPEKFRGEKATLGTGPFQLADYNRTQGTYLYTAFENYYGGDIKVDRVRFVKFSPQMSAAGLRRGSVDATAVPAELVPRLEKRNVPILRQPPVWAAKLMINHQKPPLDAKTFRHALAYAINKEHIVKIIRRGHAIPGSPGLIPPANQFWHNPEVAGCKASPDKAQALLKKLGYEKNRDGYFRKNGNLLKLNLLCSADSSHPFGRLAELLKSQLQKAGIKVNTRSFERKTLDAKIKEWNFQLAISGHGGLGGDPEILNKMIVGEGFNSARYQTDQRLVSLLQKQLRTMDRAKRRELVYQAQQRYAEVLPAITLYHPQWHWAHDGTIELFYSKGGLASGIPLPLNKLAFVE